MKSTTPIQVKPDTNSKQTPPKSSMFRIKDSLKVDSTLGISKFRLYLLRFFYAVIIMLLGVQVWTELVTHKQVWQPLPAVAFSFWAALSALAVLGLIHPLKMLPLLLVQFTYKLIWLSIVAYPLWSANQLPIFQAQGLTKANLMGVILDLLVIPWGYIFKYYILTSKTGKS